MYLSDVCDALTTKKKTHRISKRIFIDLQLRIDIWTFESIFRKRSAKFEFLFFFYIWNIGLLPVIPVRIPLETKPPPRGGIGSNIGRNGSIRGSIVPRTIELVRWYSPHHHHYFHHHHHLTTATSGIDCKFVIIDAYVIPSTLPRRTIRSSITPINIWVATTTTAIALLMLLPVIR